MVSNCCRFLPFLCWVSWEGLFGFRSWLDCAWDFLRSKRDSGAESETVISFLARGDDKDA